jgi:hypothetical protein
MTHESKYNTKENKMEKKMNLKTGPHNNPGWESRGKKLTCGYHIHY